MISPKQAYTILSLAGLLSGSNALPQAFSSTVATPSPIPTSSFATSVVSSQVSSVATGAPFPISGQTSLAGATGTVPVGTAGGPTGTGSIPISTGTPSKSGKAGVAVWWGQSKHDTDLPTQCGNDNVDTVILSFVTNNNKAGGLPKFNLNTAPGPSDAQKKAGATDLIDGSTYVDAIKKCQSGGKKVYVSLGGQKGTGEISFKSKDEAETFADQIFNLFLGGKDDKTKDLRPFGDVVLDGVDFDMESETPDFYEDFTDKLRENMKSDASTEYKISAAPQCPRTLDKDGGKKPEGDNSLPDAVLAKVDEVWVQFYNNPSCEHNATSPQGFQDSVHAWSKALGNVDFYVGTVGGPGAAGSGNLTADDQTKEISDVKAMNLANFAGYAIWDGPTAISNNNFDAVVRKALDA